MQEIIFPAPGSEKAISLGCTCPVLDNGHGKGYLGDGERFGWVMDERCPLHGMGANEKLQPQHSEQ